MKSIFLNQSNPISMATSQYFNTFIVGALLLSAVCTSTSTQPTSWDDHSPTISAAANTVTFEVPVVKDVKVFTAAKPLVVPEAPAMAYDVLNERYELVVRYVEPKCNSPTNSA